MTGVSIVELLPAPCLSSTMVAVLGRVVVLF